MHNGCNHTNFQHATVAHIWIQLNGTHVFLGPAQCETQRYIGTIEWLHWLGHVIGEFITSPTKNEQEQQKSYTRTSMFFV